MRKAKILSAVFCAVLAFGAVAAVSASAAPAEWQCGGAACNKEHAITEGKWKMLGLGLFGIELEVECNGLLDGTVGPGNADEVTSATDLSNKTKLENCTVVKESVSKTCLQPKALVEAEHLPWKTELLLVNSATEIIDHFKSSGAGLPAFKVECELSTGKFTSELCEGEVLTMDLANNAGMVEGAVLDQLSSHCNGFGVVSHVTASGLTKLLSGASLTVTD